MTVHKLEKAEWRPFLDLVSKVLPAKQAEIEVASLKLGDQVEAEWLPLLGLAYDPNNDIVEVALGGTGSASMPSASFRARVTWCWLSMGWII